MTVRVIWTPDVSKPNERAVLEVDDARAMEVWEFVHKRFFPDRAVPTKPGARLDVEARETGLEAAVEARGSVPAPTDVRAHSTETPMRHAAPGAVSAALKPAQAVSSPLNYDRRPLAALRAAARTAQELVEKTNLEQQVIARFLDAGVSAGLIVRDVASDGVERFRVA